MALNIHNLVAAIRPEIYCDPSVRKEVEEIVAKKGYVEASLKAKPIESQFLDPEDTYYMRAIDAKGLKNPVEKHTITYDAPGENLEPVYFWILDYLQANKYKNVEKLVDSFISSAGSGHFSEMGMKATKMQEEAMKMLGSANTVIKSILNIIYDLKEFRIRLSKYKEAKSKDPKKRSEGILSLKQIWMDTVDMKRGNGSINGLAQQLNFVTIRDAFMAARHTDDIRELDLNERVKRILEARVAEFYQWMEKSEEELLKRYKIEKIYLKSQVSSLQLYARWMKPYLAAAKALEQRGKGTADIVTAFNTTIFELSILAEGEYEVEKDIAMGDLPKVFAGKNKEPGYKPVIIIEYKFRTIPGRVQQQSYTFRGRIDATFTSYALNKDELKILKDEIAKDDINELAGMVTGSPEESLSVIKDEVDDFLNEDEKEKKEEEKEETKKKDDDSNPFTALLEAFSFKGLFTSDKKEEKKDSSHGLPEDDEYGRVMRSQAAFKGRSECSKFYAEFKKAQSMVG